MSSCMLIPSTRMCTCSLYSHPITYTPKEGSQGVPAAAAHGDTFDTTKHFVRTMTAAATATLDVECFSM